MHILPRPTFTALAVALLCGCGAQKDTSAILARITLDAALPATCVALRVLDSSGATLAEKRVARDSSNHELRIGIYRGDFPAQVTLRAQALYGTGCENTATPNGAAADGAGSFLSAGVKEVPLALMLPSASDDRDGDHFTDKGAGGPDCDDSNAEIHPGAAEQCGKTVDYNCDGKAGCKDPTCSRPTCAEPPTQLVFTTPSYSLGAGKCSMAIGVQLLNSSSQPQGVLNPTPVALSAAPPDGFTFYSDPTCGSAITQLDLATGSSAGSFYVAGTRAGTVTVTAAAPDLVPVSQVHRINPGAPSVLALTSAAQTLSSGACSQPVTVQSQDAYGNATSKATALTLALSAPAAAGVTFFSNAGCGTSATTLQLPANGTTATFWFRTTKAGTATLTVSAAGYTSGAQDEQIKPGPVVGLGFTTPAQTVTNGACSSVLTVEARDAANNVATVANATPVALSPTPALGFFTDAACTTPATLVLPAGGSAASFYFKPSQTGTITVSATVSGLTPATQAQTITPAAPTVLVFTSAAQSRTAATCSAQVTLRSQDFSGAPSNVPSNLAVALTAAPAPGVGFYLDPGCTVAMQVTAVTLNAGTSSASFYFKGSTAGTFNVTAAASGLGQVTQSETITAGTATALGFTPATQTPAAGACSPLQVQGRDIYGNAATVAANKTVTLTASPSAGFGFYSDAACTSGIPNVLIPSGASAASFYVKGTQVNAVQLTATTAGLTNGTGTVNIVSGPASVLVFSSAAQTLMVATCSSALIIQSRDSSSNPANVAANVTVALAASPAAGFAFFSDPGCTTSVTTATLPVGANSASVYFRGTGAGTITVTLAASGFTSGPPQLETLNAAPPSVLKITSAAQTLAAGACAAVTVQAFDPNNNPATVGAATTINLTAAPPGGVSFHTSSACAAAVTTATIPAGSGAATFYFKATQAVPITVSANAPFGADSQSETITATTATVLSLSTSATSLVAGQCSPVVTVQARDTYGNAATVAASTPVNLGVSPSAGFGFYSDSSCLLPLSPANVSLPAGAGTQTFYVQGTVSAPTVTTTASASGFTSGTLAWSISPANPTALAFTSAPQPALPAGKCSAQAAVESRDAYGNRTTAAFAVTLSSSAPSGLTFYSDATCATQVTAPLSIPAGPGTAAFYFSGITGGSVNLAAASPGLTPASQTEGIVGMMRTGTCVLPGGSSTGSCAIAPALSDPSKAFIVFQATSTDSGSDSSNVMCWISSASQVSCARAGNTGPVNIAWSIPQFANGVTVQHYQLSCITSGTATTATLLSPVDPASTFLLLSSQRSGNNQAGTVTRMATLTSGSIVDIFNSANCKNSDSDKDDLQVVTFTGASVTRGTTGAITSSSAPVTGLSSVPLASTFLLYSYRSDSAGSAICDRALRGALTSSTSLGFSRGNASASNCTGNPIDDLSFERVQLPAGHAVQAFDVSMAPGTATATQTLAAVDLTRSLAFSGGQWASGQGLGEGSIDSNGVFGDVRAWHQLTAPDTLTLTRESTVGSAQFTAFVVQFLP